MSSTNAIFTHLHATPIADLIAERKEAPVVTLKLTDSIEHAVKVLSEKHILSAPVLDETNEVVAVIGVMDILRYIVGAAPDKTSLKKNEINALRQAGRAIALVPLKQVIELSQREPIVKIYDHEPTTAAAKVFATGVHRVVLFNETNGLVGVVSQSDVVRFLSKTLHMGHLKETGEKTLAEQGFVTNEVVTVKSDDSVLHALDIMMEKNVGHVAVVNEEGRLVSNFSASDLRGLYFTELPGFTDTVAEFLEAHSPEARSPICSRPETSLIDCVKELVESKVHHLWIVDNDFKPTGIISLTDVMKIATA